nr:VWA domain-containing protein [Lachnospiraceae bacterium]
MKNFKTHKLRRAAAFLMSMVLSFTTLASDASLLSAYAATPTANVKSSVTNSTGNADVSVTKSATVDGKGNVTITFDVENKSTTQTVVTSTATEVVFVMDLSGSMQNSKERNARAAAKQFAAKLLDTSENGLNKDHNIKVGFVGFNDGATGYALTDSLTQANANIDKLVAEDDTGTNIQAGIHTARSLFSNTDCKKIMIVLSDGEATYSYEPTHMSNTQITLPDGSVTSWIDTFDYGTTKGNGIGYNYYGWTYLYSPSHRALQIQYKFHLFSSDDWYVTLNGLEMEEYYNAAGQYVDVPHSRGNYIEVYGDALDDHGLPAISEAQLAKNGGVEIFSISYGVAENEQSNASYVLKNVASTADKYKTSNAAAANLNAVVGAITKEVEHSIELARGTKIVDQLPSYMTIVDASAQSKEKGKNTDAPLFTTGASSIEWSLGEAKKATLTISAKVDIAAAVAANGLTMEDFKNGKEIKLNDSVTITYKDKDGNNKTDTSISGANVPAGIIKTYPYSISYTLDGATVASLPAVSGYAFEGQSINIPIPVGNYKTPVVKRGNTAISASEDGNYYFAAGTSNNNIVVALKTATHTVSFYGGADGKTFISKATVEHGASAAEFEPTADKIPAVEGKHFTGWNTTFTEIVDDLDVI